MSDMHDKAPQLSDLPGSQPEDVDPPAYPDYNGPSGDAVNGPRIHHLPQRRYIAICAFFVEQAHGEGRDMDFWNQCQARYFVQWPLHHTANMGAYVNQVKADLINDLEFAAAIPSCQQVRPFMHWEHMFALSAVQFDEAGAQMLSEQSQIDYENLLARSGGPKQASPPPVAGPSSACRTPASATPAEVPSARPKNTVFIDLTSSKSPLKAPWHGEVLDLTTASRVTEAAGVIDLTWIDDEVVDVDMI